MFKLNIKLTSHVQTKISKILILKLITEKNWQIYQNHVPILYLCPVKVFKSLRVILKVLIQMTETIDIMDIMYTPCRHQTSN